jgi:hypothetical protein
MSVPLRVGKPFEAVSLVEAQRGTAVTFSISGCTSYRTIIEIKTTWD